MARPIARDHDDKRGRILKHAAAIFADQGFDRASVSQIARACGISKANIYHYYPGKDALLFDLLDGYLRELRDRVCAIPGDGMGVEDRLRATVREVLRAYQGADDHHRVLIAGLSALPEDRQQILRDYQRDMVRHLSAILAEAAPGRFDADPGALRAATMSVFGMLNWYFMWNSGAGTAARDAYADMVSTLTLDGVRGL